MTRHRLEVIAAFVLGIVLALTLASPVSGGKHNCKPAWKCATPTTAATLRVTAAPTVRITTAPTVAATPTRAPTLPPTAPPTSCGTSLQARIDAAPSGSTLDLTGCAYTAGASISKPLTLVGVTITGPQSSTYNSAQNGLVASGPGITIRGCTISRFGGEGIRVTNASNLVIEDCTIRDIVYAGIMVISTVGGRISGNTVERIGVTGSSANSGNAYGIALTQLIASSPRTTDFLVSGNTVTDVPTWQCLDTHGGARITWTGNTVSGCRDGIYITGWPTNRALDNIIDGNSVTNAGSNQYGITSVYSTGGQVTNNLIAGWLAGHAILTTSGSDPEATAIDLTISGNVIQ